MLGKEISENRGNFFTANPENIRKLENSMNSRNPGKLKSDRYRDKEIVNDRASEDNFKLEFGLFSRS